MMARYRTPQQISSPYITEEGFQVLQDELKNLWKHRGDVTKALAAAAAEGDRSENAEYIYRKKELREIDRRIRYLQKRLPDLRVVAQDRGVEQHIYFGAWVTLEKEDGDEVTYRIVGPDEFDAARGYISVDSPMATSLLKKTVGDEITVRTDRLEQQYVVLAVSYTEL